MSPRNPGSLRSTSWRISRQRTDLLATRIGVPPARASISRALAQSASRSTSAKGACTSRKTSSSSSKVRARPGAGAWGAVTATQPIMAEGTVPAVPAPVLVLLAVTSVQLGGALAKTLFDDAGFGGSAFLRVGLAALVMGPWWRPASPGGTADSLRSPRSTG